MPNDLLGEIHSSTATTSPDWATFRGEVTGMYLLSGQGGEWDSQHLIREYNRNINSMYKSWTPTEPNATGLFLEPYNAGFSYQGTGDFRDYKWDTYSVDFDGVDDYVSIASLGTGVIGTVHTYSAWHKMADLNDQQDDIIAGGNGQYFELLIWGGGANQRMFYGTMSGASTASVSTTTSTDPTFTLGWHHYAVVRDETAVKFYQDGAKLGTTKTLSANYLSKVTDLQKYNSVYGEGKLDEVAVWDSALSDAQITAIYNGGTPQSLASYSPTAWWRMGDGPLDDGDERLIGDQMNLTLGSELLTNGDFSDNSVPDTWNGSAPVNLVGWTSGGSAYTATAHFVITDGKCRLISDGANIILNGGTCVVGKTYEYSYEVTDVTTGGFTIIGGGVVLGLNITSVGTYTGVFTAAATTAMAINRNAGTTDATIANVSIKEFNGYVGRMKNMTASDIVADTP